MKIISKPNQTKPNMETELIKSLKSARFFVSICLRNFKKEGLTESIIYAEKELQQIDEALKKAAGNHPSR
jgi:hypothetical protein